MLEQIAVFATFTSPQDIGTNPQSMLWLLPLSAAIAVVYKATRTTTIKTRGFLKETMVLFLSIVVFLAITAIALHLISRVATE